ncbi:PAS domain S-box protein [Sneathiella aquimaris]|uniref:PAS domain S-box protein n=1 Tax=Sneathiella aquimaris TaxID=2599305 RepID=UPI00146CAC8D|nr:PAS domain-containing sensor histidine kinase [Sneathiella aquimaris]
MISASFDLITHSDKIPSLLLSVEGDILALNPAAKKRFCLQQNQNLVTLFGSGFERFLSFCSGSRDNLFSRQKLKGPDEVMREYRCEGAAIVFGDEKAILLRFKSIERSLAGFSRVNQEHGEFRDKALSEQRLQTVIDAALDIIILSDQTGKIILVNKAIKKIMGYSTEEVVGQNVKMLMPLEFSEKGDPQTSVYDHSKIEQSVGAVREVVARRKDGSQYVANLSVGTSRFVNETYYTCIIHDLSEYKNIELRLQQSQKMEALGKLSGGVAHDFNNLLSVIIGRLEFARENIKEETTDRHIRAALSAADKGAGLIDQLLSFSRQKHLNNEVLNLGTVVQEALEMIGRGLGEHIDISLEIRNGEINAFADAVQLNNALINLATNARDAMPEAGKLSILVEPVVVDGDTEDERVKNGGRYVRIAVTDSGSGMSEDVKKQAVEPFYTTKEVGEGTGLGLSMVHGYVEQSGGFMNIESTIGEGTTVNLYFRGAD